MKTMKKSNKLIVGILAHVDSGKTTLAESMLYTSGQIRKYGRVDHGDTFLDTEEQERSRGITIFSKQAELQLPNKAFTLLDTPGHVDFSTEMERTLQVLDYAILVISGTDGVQGHVQTLWRLLDHYQIPVFLFVNKMDQVGLDKRNILTELQKRLNENIIDFTPECRTSDFYESLAMLDETSLNSYLEKGELDLADIQTLIQKRQVFPCFFGSALKMQGIDSFLQELGSLTRFPEYPEEFGSRVFKISRDKQGQRLTHIKITGGKLKVKTELKPGEKIDQIRIYSGSTFQTVHEITAGSVCTLTGLQSTYCGEGLGTETTSSPILTPVLTYRILLPQETDIYQTYLRLQQLEEEDPTLHLIWNEQTKEIHAQVMGEIQIEILKQLIWDRFQIQTEFGNGSIVYKETISEPVEGCGHYEPLRHYAEVRLLLEPLPPGSGLILEANCSEDLLSRNWQRLIYTHLCEKIHPGVLTGSEITDMKISLLTGKAHLKHTEGGDFRQATYRAVRQGLKSAKNILLEPVYEYQLEVPSELVGRAMSDLQKMHAEFTAPELDGEMSVLKGTAPVVCIRNYQRELMSYSQGRGRLFLQFKGYEPCHNEEEVLASIQYDSERDTEHPTGSVFCSHGAGYTVPWNEVPKMMHTTSPIKPQQALSHTVGSCLPPVIDEEELKAIFERTYGSVERKKPGYLSPKKISYSEDTYKISPPKRLKGEEEYLLVDGYNIIFAWKDLKNLAQSNIDGARDKLMDILSNYQGYKNQTLILVFDAYKVPGNIGEVQKYHNIYVVYTKEAETADQYIEKTVQKIGKHYSVTVATSDAMEQMIILGQGANRISARGLLEEICLANQELRNLYLDQIPKSGQTLFEHLDPKTAEFLNDVRIGRRHIEEYPNQKNKT